MKITEPYSPSARAKASVNPVSVAGSSVGSSTFRNVCPRDAPRLAAASSTSSSMSCRTGCTVRTTNGRPINVSATKTPSGVLATWMPCGSSQRPSQLPVPLALNSAASVMPATAVGRANGRSTSPSTSRRPGNEYRVSTQATSSPKTALTSAAAKDAPKLSRNAARVRGSVTICQKA